MGLVHPIYRAQSPHVPLRRHAPNRSVASVRGAPNKNVLTVLTTSALVQSARQATILSTPPAWNAQRTRTVQNPDLPPAHAVLGSQHLRLAPLSACVVLEQSGATVAAGDVPTTMRE